MESKHRKQYSYIERLKIVAAYNSKKNKDGKMRARELDLLFSDLGGARKRSSLSAQIHYIKKLGEEEYLGQKPEDLKYPEPKYQELPPSYDTSVSSADKINETGDHEDMYAVSILYKNKSGSKMRLTTVNASSDEEAIGLAMSKIEKRENMSGYGIFIKLALKIGE